MNQGDFTNAATLADEVVPDGRRAEKPSRIALLLMVRGITRCVAALSELALQRGDPHLAARLIGTTAAVRDRFGLTPWPSVTQAEGRTVERAAALLPGGEYAAQLAVGRSQTIDEALTAALPILEDRQSAAA